MEVHRTRPSIPLAQPNISQQEIDLVLEVLRSGVLSMGDKVREFERRMASLSGRSFAVACSSGTAGLHLAVRALGIGEGDEVITTPFSFVASANCILYEHARPRFVDIEEETLGLDPALADAAASDRTRAVLPVHVFGNACRIEEIEALAESRGWALIEDACEALGTTINDRPLGSFGHASVFAFYPNKQITTGEGGMLVTDDASLAELCASMRNQGRDTDGTWLRHVRLGFNYRLDELSAALGVAQLRRREELRRGRNRVAKAYAERLAQRDWLELPKAREGSDVDWFVYVIRLSESIDRDGLIGDLQAASVPARPYFSPLHLQPLYRERFGHQRGDFPVTERVAASTLALPFSSSMAESDVDFVSETLIECAEATRR